MRKWLKTSPTFTPRFANIDRDQGVIKGVKMVSEGEAKGHGMFINSDFIDKLVKLAKREKKGVRARFGHPNMCNESLGTFLGLFKNVRREEESAIGDLYFSQTAKKTPNGDLYNYIFDLALDDPNAFGSSIVFDGGMEEGELDGETVLFATIDTLEYTDLVGEPAATDGLFSTDSLADTVTRFLDENPEIFTAIEKNPNIFDEFLTRYTMFNNKKKKALNKLLKFKSGEQVIYQGKLEEGTELEPVEMETLPDGDYMIEDGRMITVVDGVITAVKEAEPMKEGDEELEEAFSKLTVKLTEAINEAIEPFEERLSSLETELTELRKKGSKGTPPKGEGKEKESLDIHGRVQGKVKEIFNEIKRKREGV